MAAEDDLGMREQFFACFEAYKKTRGEASHKTSESGVSNNAKTLQLKSESKACAWLKRKLLAIFALCQLPSSRR